MICQLLLITNRKSHRGFRLVPISVTLNDLERRYSPYFAFFSQNLIDFQADYITVVEGRSIMSVKYCLPVLVFHFWPKLPHPAAQSLCDGWVSCFILICYVILWPSLDLEVLQLFGSHAFKLCTTFERNLRIHRWVINDLARFRRAILGVGHNWRTVFRGAWTQLNQTRRA